MEDREKSQSRQLSNRLSTIESQIDDLRREVIRTRHTVRRTWFFSEFVSPLIALAVFVGAVYLGIRYVEDRFLGGASIVSEIQKVLDEQ